MIRGYTAQQVREAERPHLAAGEPLMQRAAQALADRILQLLESRPDAPRPRVLLLIGSGDNGGDALFAGARLARSGVFAGADVPRRTVEVSALGVGSRMHEAGRAEALTAGVRFVDADAATIDALGRTDTADTALRSPAEAPRELPARATSDYDIIVDGIIGTGTSTGSPALRGTARAVVLAIRSGLGERAGADGDIGGPTEATHAPGPIVVAVDIPSGIDPDTGAVADDAVLPADVTVTFGGIKAGLLLGAGARLAGRVDLVEIGIENDLAAMTPVVDLP
ncbi:NAD(P)H-hydrate epimerase [Herbiconiux ginsengi]|uniref:NAD(P)H-hydrate epimerase n=1 Tax=Herbiconiux ginsengi TaxID=381665 RepID=A0A1H3U3X8_9MICO|nr:NAD(P)H-hydrate epimerase [Herbiconiux ginsengi]SDZ57166.1 NAD(P)H-hydrate repair enzyme Nnr, NAD(P)H-hydrate epimerase domain [Herbiconiux ginsengi]